MGITGHQRSKKASGSTGIDGYIQYVLCTLAGGLGERQSQAEPESLWEEAAEDGESEKIPCLGFCWRHGPGIVVIITTDPINGSRCASCQVQCSHGHSQKSSRGKIRRLEMLE